MGKWADEFPEHSRTSCNDENRYNAHPSGKWCERCTALVMDDAQPPAVGVDVSALRGLISGWRSMEGKPDGSYEEGYYDSRRHAAGELESALHAALRTGGGAS